MTSCRFVVLCLLCVVTHAIIIESPVYAQLGMAGEFVDCFEYIRENDPTTNGPQTVVVTITKTPLHYLGIGVPLYAGVLFENSEPCGNTGHRTLRDSSGLLNSNSTSRCFKHIHVTYEHPIHGIDQFGNIRLVTESNVEAFWHYYYSTLFYRPSWTYYGGITPKVNCWGYAFGYSTWVEDPELIYYNDYGDSSVFSVEAGHLIEHDGHVIVVTGVVDYPMSGPMWTPGLKMVTKTRERNRSSGVYESEWTPSKQPASSFRVKKN